MGGERGGIQCVELGGIKIREAHHKIMGSRFSFLLLLTRMWQFVSNLGLSSACHFQISQHAPQQTKDLYKPLTVYKDGQHESFLKVNQKHMYFPLVVG